MPNPMKIEKNIARTEHVSDGYKVVITVEKLKADEITQAEAEIHLTKTAPFLFTQRVRY